MDWGERIRGDGMRQVEEQKCWRGRKRRKRRLEGKKKEEEKEEEKLRARVQQWERPQSSREILKKDKKLAKEKVCTIKDRKV